MNITSISCLTDLMDMEKEVLVFPVLKSQEEIALKVSKCMLTYLLMEIKLLPLGKPQ